MKGLCRLLRPKKYHGKLIVIDGTDGSGKATQLELLVDRLHQDGFNNVRTTDFPRYGKWSARLVEMYLNGRFGTADQVGARVSASFYALDRFAASFEMYRWLCEGDIVISNRYVASSKGHQGGKIHDPTDRRMFLDWLSWLEYDFFNIPREDHNILLHVPSEVNLKLIAQRGQRSYETHAGSDIHENDPKHLADAASAYRQIAYDEGWTVIECIENGTMRTREDIHQEMYESILPILR